MQAEWWKVNEKGQEVQIEISPDQADGTFSLEALQRYAAGPGEDRATIDMVCLPLIEGETEQYMMVFNDNGKVMEPRLPMNGSATVFYGQHFPIDKFPFNNGQVVVGNVVVCPARMVR